jgi:hypothetical protein
MKPMMKKVKNAHSFSNDTKRKRENKTPKKAACRASTKSAFRQVARRDLKKQIQQGK